jgi:hypothetical protein
LHTGPADRRNPRNAWRRAGIAIRLVFVVWWWYDEGGVVVCVLGGRIQRDARVVDEQGTSRAWTSREEDLGGREKHTAVCVCFV